MAGPTTGADLRVVCARLWERLARLARKTPLTLLAAGLVLVVYLSRYLAYDGNLIHGDGHYSWVMARSLAFDGDLNLANDYTACGDERSLGVEEGGGRPADPFYLGPALLWVPFLRLARALIPVAASAPAAWRNGCDGPWAHFVLTLAPLCGVLAVWLGARVARRWVSERAAAVALVVLGLGSTLLHYASLVPSYSHVWAALGVALSL